MKMIREDPDLPANMTPPCTHCLYHRCVQHQNVPQLNANETNTESECGACIGQELWHLDKQVLPASMDCLADYLTSSAILKSIVAALCQKIETLAPGTGEEEWAICQVIWKEGMRRAHGDPAPTPAAKEGATDERTTDPSE